MNVIYVAPGPCNVDNTHKGHLLAANAGAGGVHFILPPAAEFGCGVVSFKKIDWSSNLVDIVSPAQELEDNVLDTLQLPLQFDALTLACDGVDRWWLIHQNLAGLMHNGFVVAEHTVTTAFYQIDRSYCNYIMQCSSIGIGQPQMLVLPKLSSLIKPGSHTCWMVGVKFFPDGSGPNLFKSVVTMPGDPGQPGDTIADPRAVPFGGVGQWKLDITVPGASFWFYADGARYTIEATNGLQ